MADRESIINPFEQEGILNTFDEIQAESFFATPELRSAFLRDLTFEDYTNFLTLINESFQFDVSEVLDPTNTSQHMIIRSDTNQETGKVQDKWPIYIAPGHEHRPLLLNEAFTVAQELEDVEQAATLLGLSLSMVHPFNDGNGRTSRILYSLLTHGYDGSSADRQYFTELSSHEGREIVYFSQEAANLPGLFVGRELRTKQLYDEPKQLIDLQPRKGDSWKWRTREFLLGKTGVDLMLQEGYFGLPLLMEKVKEDGRRLQDCSAVTISVSGQTIQRLDIGEVYARPKDIDQRATTARHTQLKLEYIRTVIDCFRPETPDPLISSDEITRVYASPTKNA